MEDVVLLEIVAVLVLDDFVVVVLGAGLGAVDFLAARVADQEDGLDARRDAARRG